MRLDSIVAGGETEVHGVARAAHRSGTVPAGRVTNRVTGVRFDSAGAFRLRVEPDSQVLYFNAIGYRNTSHVVRLAPGTTAWLTVRMARSCQDLTAVKLGPARH